MGHTGDEDERRAFVILQHDHPFLHWDFLIEEGDQLAAWRLLKQPETGQPIPAEPLPLHRRHYLTYEGPVSGNRGSVIREYSGWLIPQQSGGFSGCQTELRFDMHSSPLASACCLRTSAADASITWEFTDEPFHGSQNPSAAG